MNIKYKLKKIKIIYYPYRKIRNFFDKFKYEKRNKAIKQYGYEMLNNVCKQFKKNNIPAFCAYGTLLGFIRDNGFISYDLDIDMGLLSNEDFSWEKIDKILKSSGLELKHQFKLNDGTITERTYYLGDATIDFFLFKISDNEMISYIYEQETYSKKYHVRESRVPLAKKIEYIEKNNIIVPIISNYEEYLETVYGKNWKIPDPNFKHEEKILEDKEGYIERFKK